LKTNESTFSRGDSLKDVFSGVVKSLNENARHDEAPSNIREIKKAVLQYVNEVPNFHTKEDNSFKKEDLTPSGIKRIL
jgi:hypothetical protein